jgi:hypothetical protein
MLMASPTYPGGRLDLAWFAWSPCCLDAYDRPCALDQRRGTEYGGNQNIPPVRRPLCT